MSKKIISFVFIIVLAFTFSGCANGNSFQSQLDELQKKIEEQEDKFDALEKEKSSLVEKIVMLESEKDALNSKLDDFEGENKRLREEIEYLENELEKLAGPGIKSDFENISRAILVLQCIALIKHIKKDSN